MWPAMRVDPTTARVCAGRPRDPRPAPAMHRTRRSESSSGPWDPSGQRSRSSWCLLGAGDEVRHAVDPTAPHRFVLIEETARQAESLDVRAHDHASPRALLGDEARALQHGDMLLDRGERHRIVRCQLADAFPPAQGAQDDVASGRVGEGGEDAVSVEGGLHWYNHTVVSRGRQVAATSYLGRRYFPSTPSARATAARWRSAA